MSPSFYSEGIKFQLDNPRATTKWVRAAANREGKSPKSITYIFCTDSYLLELNKRFLKHTTLTDILTFSYSENSKDLVGEVYISIERVRENALKFHASFDDELHRVIIHGLLHLVGYDDKTPSQKAEMRKKEDAYLSLRQVSRGTKK